MKTKTGFHLREVCGEYMLIAEGKENIDFSNIISMNESAAFLWKHIEGTEFDAQTLASLLTSEYEIDIETALHDAQALMDKWFEAGIVEK